MGVVVEVCGTVVVLDNSDEYNLKKLQDMSDFSMSVLCYIREKYRCMF